MWGGRRDIVQSVRERRGQRRCPLGDLTFLIATQRRGQAFSSSWPDTPVQKMHQSICKCAGKRLLNSPAAFSWLQNEHLQSQTGLSVSQVEGNTVFRSLVLAARGAALCPAAFQGQSAAPVPPPRDIPFPGGAENSPSCSPVPMARNRSPHPGAAGDFRVHLQLPSG